MVDAIVIGALGGIAIILSWVYETAEAIKKHKSLIDLRFAALNLSGALMLIIYSWQIGSPVFLYLNTVLFLIVLAEIAYTIAARKVHRKRRK